jgi:glycosyltransferase involved in cell wall biosynthesis
MSIAGVVIASNEEVTIECCLKSLAFCDEIIVVDSASTDGTADIARRHCTRFETRVWSGYADQKNHANLLAQSDWILSLDADEEVTEELRLEILQTLASPQTFMAFTIPRKTYHSGQWIRYGGWYPNRVARLFRRGSGRWVPLPVHEHWQSDGPVGKLSSDLHHYSFRSFSDQVRRNDTYTSLAAKRLAIHDARPSMAKLLFKPTFKFVETYFLKLGLLDGYRGFFISVSAAYAVFLKWAKIWELRQGEKS